MFDLVTRATERKLPKDVGLSYRQNTSLSRLCLEWRHREIESRSLLKDIILHRIELANVCSSKDMVSYTRPENSGKQFTDKFNI